MDFFEIERVIEELARTIAAPNATTWFKLAGNKEPTREEYRRKVVEFINLIEDSLCSGYKDTLNSNDLLDFVKKAVKDQSKSVLSGNNKDVEKRYKYYVNS